MAFHNHAIQIALTFSILGKLDHKNCSDCCLMGCEYVKACLAAGDKQKAKMLP